MKQLRFLKHKKRIIIGTLSLAVIITAGFVTKSVLSSGKKGAANLTQSYEVTTGDVDSTVSATGNISMDDTTDVVAATGVIVKKVLVETGDEVKKGDILAQLDKTSVVSLLLEAKETKEDLEDQLDDDDLSDLEEEKINGEIEEINERISDLNKLHENPVIKATADGVISAVNVSEGSEITNTGSSSTSSQSDSTDSTAASSTPVSDTGSTAVKTASISGSTAAGSTSANKAAAGTSSFMKMSFTGQTGRTAAVAVKMSDMEAASTASVEDNSSSAITAAAGSEEASTSLETATTDAEKNDAADEDSSDASTKSESQNQNTTDSQSTSAENNTGTGSTQNNTGTGSTQNNTGTSSTQNNTGTSSTQTGTETGSSQNNKNSSQTQNGTTTNKNVSLPSGSGAAGGMGGASGTASSVSASSSSGTTTEFYGTYKGVAFSISTMKNAQVTVSIDELDILSIKKGQTAKVTLDALSDQEFEGTISKISTTATSSNGNTKYDVEISLPMADDMMDGMSASVVIVTDSAEDAVVIPVLALQERGDKQYVYTKKDEDGNLSGQVEVETGLSDGTNVVITSGLSEGDTIYYQVASGDDSADMKNFGMQQGPGGNRPDGGFGGNGGPGGDGGNRGNGSGGPGGNGSSGGNGGGGN